MQYKSTRNSELKVSGAEAIITGLAPDGGLFIPESIPAFNHKELEKLASCSYNEGAVMVLSKYLTDFSEDELWECVNNAYNKENFSGGEPFSLVDLDNSTSVLELWHGPTCAFKDVALQLLPDLLRLSMKKCGDNRKALILAATSGDTGKAALEGFKDKDGVSVVVFYPKYGVSAVQELQMVTQEGSNVSVVAVDGNFDDAQRAVKQIFRDKEVEELLKNKEIFLSSANSINLGRLLPQIVYYCIASARLCAQGKEEITFVVPTGNFGNILACYYAKEMGAPIEHISCASNNNKILSDFLKTGVYDVNREFYKTFSPSMDILVSSNLERFLYEISRDSHWVESCMKELDLRGKYEVTEERLFQIQAIFSAACCNDYETIQAIKAVWQDKGYLIDPHTAVAFHSMNLLGLSGHRVVVSTASPYKFPKSAACATGIKATDEFDAIQKLSESANLSVPHCLQSLETMPHRHQTVKEIDALRDWVVESCF